MSKKNNAAQEVVQEIAPELPPEVVTEAPAQKKQAVLGRFVGFEALAKERYRLAVLDTVDGEIAARQDIDCGIGGISMHQAFYRFNSLINRQVRFYLPNLWRFNPEIVGIEAARAALEEYETAMKLRGKVIR